MHYSTLPFDVNLPEHPILLDVHVAQLTDVGAVGV
jgi:hypothetical protein